MSYSLFLVSVSVFCIHSCIVCYFTCDVCCFQFLVFNLALGSIVVAVS